MKISLRRILSIVMVFAVTTAASYQSLCAVDVINCAPCEKSESENDHSLICKLCKQSKDVGSVTISINKISVHQDAVNTVYTNIQEFVFASPEFIMAEAQAPPVVLVRPHTEITKTITPIRGPSITA